MDNTWGARRGREWGKRTRWTASDGEARPAVTTPQGLCRKREEGDERTNFTLPNRLPLMRQLEKAANCKSLINEKAKETGIHLE